METKYTYYHVEFKNCSIDTDYIIAQELEEISEILKIIDSDLDDDTFEEGRKPCAIITGIGMTRAEYQKYLDEASKAYRDKQDEENDFHVHNPN